MSGRIRPGAHLTPNGRPCGPPSHSLPCFFFLSSGVIIVLIRGFVAFLLQSLGAYQKIGRAFPLAAVANELYGAVSLASQGCVSQACDTPSLVGVGLVCRTSRKQVKVIAVN
ncbi:hypothetical protein CDAR_239871 [Caerostris darwini]|uniref:Uncharacterized protein n=1 Tax=Caerostris darwini TaxID=1538125 RepID=A0AAV4R1E5_9ARAC|nr:hypothetical protein CDAR_239871 [Caerostris darwini]